ncbi:MAG: alpha/beta fold hydrolase [Psittacicella sp.]
MEVLVFLHGFLGSSLDFFDLRSKLKIESLVLDFPGFGKELPISQINFNSLNKWLDKELFKISKNYNKIHIFSYSMGGRILLNYLFNYKFKSKINIGNIFFEGVNFGLKTKKEKEIRLNNDRLWANRFLKDELSNSLNIWYTQGIFSSIKGEKLSDMINLRLSNDKLNLYKYILGVSLAKQQDFYSLLKKSKLKYYYFVGELDLKFNSLCKNWRINSIFISNSSHNIHYDNPLELSLYINKILFNLSE